MTLTADVSLPVSRKPDLWVGTATANRVIKGDGTLAPLAAAAGTSRTRAKADLPTADA